MDGAHDKGSAGSQCAQAEAKGVLEDDVRKVVLRLRCVSLRLVDDAELEILQLYRLDDVEGLPAPSKSQRRQYR